MATIQLNSSPAKLSVVGTNTYVLGAPSGSETGAFVVGFVGTAFVGTINTAERVGGVSNTAAPFVAIPYSPLNLAGTANIGTPVTTDLSGDFLISVAPSGGVLGLLVTVTSGSGVLYFAWVEGGGGGAGGSSGGGAGDASAANQTTQIALATSANTKLDTLHTDLATGPVPVSGPLTNAQLTAAALATSALQTSANTKLDQLHTDLTSGGTQAISAASLPLPTGAAQDATLTSGTQKTKVVDTGGSTAATVKAASTASVATDTGLVVALHPSSPVSQATLTKGTQGATGVTTQDLKDAGRTSVTLTVDKLLIAAIAETLVTTMQSSSANGAHSGNISSYAITAAKIGRLQLILSSLFGPSGSTTAAGVIFRIRVNNAGAATITSPVQMIWHVQGQGAPGQSGNVNPIAIPDGFEFPAAAGIGITVECPTYVVTTAAPLVSTTKLISEY